MTVKPVMIEHEDTLVAMLRGRREALGWSQSRLDDRVAWADGYCSKVEAPHRKYGRRVIWGLMDTVSEWAQALGLCLVLMDRKQAELLIAQSTAPPIDEAHPQAYAGRDRDGGGLVTNRTLRLSMTFRRAA